MSKRSVPDADVIVIGAGLTGGVLAALLRQSGFSVVMVEAHAAGREDNIDTPDPRALAVTPASRRLLEHIGVWQQLPAERIGVFRRMEVWERAAIHFDCAELGEQALGYIIEAVVLQQALDAVLAADNGLEWCRPALPAALECGAEAILKLDSGRKLRARLIVGADGRNSRSRSLAGISYLESPYPQQALACVVETGQPHAAVARQRFLADGPLAFLPLADEHQSGIVWSTTPEHARALLTMPETEFADTLAEAFEQRLGGIHKVGRRAAFPLFKAEATHYCRPRFALIGDAAHSVHPLAGQGANLGWLDAAALAEVLTDARTGSRDPGSFRVLRQYERWRRGENRIMQLVLDGLHHLFLRGDPVTVQLRNVGLNLTDHSGPIKNYLMRYAMGRAGDVPKLLRRET